MSLRKMQSFRLASIKGQAEYLENGGREIRAKACAENKKRRDAVSNMMKKRWQQNDFRKKISEKTKESLSIPIRGFCIKTKKTHSFDSSVEAGIFLGDKRKSGNIRSCLIGKQKTAYGFTWEYMQ